MIGRYILLLKAGSHWVSMTWAPKTVRWTTGTQDCQMDHWQGYQTNLNSAFNIVQKWPNPGLESRSPFSPLPTWRQAMKQTLNSADSLVVNLLTFNSNKVVICMFVCFLLLAPKCSISKRKQFASVPALFPSIFTLAHFALPIRPVRTRCCWVMCCSQCGKPHSQGLSSVAFTT